MSNNIARASAIFSADTREKVANLYIERDLAAQRVRENQNSLMERVALYLKNHPGEILTVNDIADASGLKRSAVRDWFDRNKYRMSLRYIKVKVERKYAEVDDKGYLIPEGRTMTTSWYAGAYYYTK